MKNKLIRINVYIFLLASLVSLLMACSTDEKIGIQEVQNEQEVTKFLNASSNSDMKFVYFGRPSCEYCQAFKPKLENSAKKEKMTVYYYNTDKYRDSSNFESTLKQYGVTKIPYLVKIENGEIKDSIFDVSHESEITEFIQK
ncbi:thioredoxin family protein [Listeria booriae]|uniref:thioredoxin family protein n=1 Tax=Listeria booriae TaxID=1552123 RepID=UPI00162989E7|nr:thioredoxin family protein [Listeria booriae]MBC2035431.1 thioredoxin family protein [Listeria booriae]